jgi:hypothetical protein
MKIDNRRQKATLEFTDDNTVFQRQFAASLGVTSQDQNDKGIYVPQLLFNSEPPEGHQAGYHRLDMDPKTRQIFETELERFPRLTPVQKGFAIECLAPHCALAIGQGPPGTGKTTTIVAVIQAAIKAGLKVLVCTQNRGAKHQLIRGWVEQSDKNVHKDEWCDWSGAYAKSGYKYNPEFRGPPPMKVSNTKETPGDGAEEPPVRRRRIGESGTASQYLALDALGNPATARMATSPAAAAETNVDDTDISTLDGLAEIGLQAAKQAAEETTRIKAEEAAAERLLNEHMQAHFIDQAMELGGRPDAGQYGFNHRCLQFATAAESCDWGELTNVATRWLDIVRKLAPMTKADQKSFMNLEIQLNQWLLEETKVVFSTCNMAAHETLAEDFKPDMIIIDEAGAALTMEMAIPIVTYRKSTKSVVLLGDHEQLAPNFVSGGQNSASRELRKTVFDRYAKGAGSGTVRVDLQPELFRFDVQHRSHPEIMDWASNAIYGGRIQHGPDTKTPTNISRTIDEYLQRTVEYFKRDAVLAVSGVSGQEAKDGRPAVKAVTVRNGTCYRMGVNVNTTASAPVGNDTSPRNMGEVDFITEFLHDLFSFMPKGPATRPLVALDILVETPYSAQRTALREALKDPKLHPQCRHVDVCSLAGVQGREASVVIFSMVQNNEEEAHNVGILKVGRNLNVASTRAKKLSVTVGNFELFLQSIANRDKKFFQGNFDKFRSFIEDFHVKNDIIRDTDLVKALHPANSTVLVRDESD